MDFKNKGLLRIHYNGRKPVISYLYKDDELYFATARTSRKMDFFNNQSKDVEISLGCFGKERIKGTVEILQDDEAFFNQLKKDAGLPPFVNFKKHQSIKIHLK